MKRSLKLLALVLPVALLVIISLNRTNIYDWWRLRGYQPSPRIEQLAANTTMTDKGKKYFYVAHPAIETQAGFNEHCDIKEFSIILGCYSGRNIYLYDIQDERLSGVLEVTAAHEMLHVAYDRLSPQKRSEVDAMTEAAYKKLTNKRVKATIQNYEMQGLDVIPNERHSILGTEVRSLPTELENYYRQYFKDRQKIVAYSERYESEFTSRQQKVATYDTQLKSLKSTISSNQEELNERAQSLRAERDRLDRLRESGSVSEYNAAVNGFNNQVDAYNNLAASTRNLIERYNNIVAERNSLALEVEDLVQAIDSTPETFQR